MVTYAVAEVRTKRRCAHEEAANVTEPPVEPSYAIVEDVPAVTAVVEAVVFSTYKLSTSPFVVRQSENSKAAVGVVSVDAAVMLGVVVAYSESQIFAAVMTEVVAPAVCAIAATAPVLTGDFSRTSAVAVKSPETVFAPDNVVSPENVTAAESEMTPALVTLNCPDVPADNPCKKFSF